jgi:hypothetical protein
MERLLGERHREYAESIAYHFQNSDTLERAVPYLVIAGKEAVERYALAEAETYYRSAYDILTDQPETAERDHALLELIVEWSLLHYYTADLLSSSRLIREHADLLERVPDPELRGMWLAWHCFVGYCLKNFAESVAFGDRAIAIGEESGSTRVLAYAYRHPCQQVTAAVLPTLEVRPAAPMPQPQIGPGRSCPDPQPAWQPTTQPPRRSQRR